MDEFEDFKTSVEKVIAGVVEIVRELQLEVKSGDMTEFLLSNEKKKLADVGLLLRDEQGNWLLKMETTSGENFMKIFEMRTMNLEYHINLVDKAVAEFERINSNFKRNSTMVKRLSNSIAHYGKMVHE